MSFIDLSEFSNFDISFSECKKYALFYKSKLLIGYLQFFDSPQTCFKDIYSPQNIWGVYLQKGFKFYNVFDVIKSQNFKNLSPRSSAIVFEKYRYTITHVLCYSGQSEYLKAILTDSFILIIEIFGNSPFFYAIKKKSQECVDILLDFISSLFLYPETLRFKATLQAMKNDFSLIIQNSSIKLYDFLNKLLITSPVFFAKINFNSLPFFHFHARYDCILADFTGQESKNVQESENPIRLQKTAFGFNCFNKSKENLELLVSIANCKNGQIFKTPFIQYFIKLQWKNIENWAIFYSILISVNILLFIGLLGFTEISLSDVAETSSIIKLLLLISFTSVNCLLICWEVFQFKSDQSKYFNDPLNWFDKNTDNKCLDSPLCL